MEEYGFNTEGGGGKDGFNTEGGGGKDSFNAEGSGGEDGSGGGKIYSTGTMKK